MCRHAGLTKCQHKNWGIPWHIPKASDAFFVIDYTIKEEEEDGWVHLINVDLPEEKYFCYFCAQHYNHCLFNPVWWYKKHPALFRDYGHSPISFPYRHNILVHTIPKAKIYENRHLK